MKDIQSSLKEKRSFSPKESIKKNANLKAHDLEQYTENLRSDPNKFWGELANRELHWFKPFKEVLDWSNPPFAKWFQGGKTNISFNWRNYIYGRNHFSNGKTCG